MRVVVRVDVPALNFPMEGIGDVEWANYICSMGIGSVASGIIVTAALGTEKVVIP